MTLQAFRQARSRAKNAAIIAAAGAAFGRDGYERAAIEQIANAARVSTATLYRYFPSKTALFRAVAADALERLEALPVSAAAPDRRLEALAVAYAVLLSRPETRAIMRMLIAETGRNSDLAAEFYQSIKTRISETFAAAYAAGVTEGRLSPTDDVPHAAGQLQGMIEHATLLRGLILGDNATAIKPPEAIAASAMITFLARWGSER